MNLAYGLFMAEAEGYLKTHRQKVEDMVRDLRRLQLEGADPIAVDDYYLAKFGLTMASLTPADYCYMDRILNNQQSGFIATVSQVLMKPLENLKNFCYNNYIK